MALKKGICKNYGECMLAESRQVQEKDSTEFVCEECGKPLEEVENGGHSNSKPIGKRIAFIAGGVILLAAIVGACVLLFRGGTQPLEVALNKSESELVVGEMDTLTAKVTPVEQDYTATWMSDNEKVLLVSNSGIVTALSEGTANVTLIVKTKKEELKSVCHYVVGLPVEDTPKVELVDFTRIYFVREKIEMKVGDTVQLSLLKEPVVGEEPIQWLSSDKNVVTVDTNGLIVAVGAGNAEVKVTTGRSQLTALMPVAVAKAPAAPAKGGKAAKPSSGKLNLGYATYEGPVQNGKAHGNGTMYFKQRSIIPGTVNVYAEAGEKVVGSFRNGRVNIATVYRNNGNRVVIREGQDF